MPNGSTAVLHVTISPVFPNVPNNAANRTWSGPSGVITTTNKFFLSAERYRLVIQDVGPNDTGLYTFTAANTVGSAIVTIKLVLQGISNDNTQKNILALYTAIAGFRPIVKAVKSIVAEPKGDTVVLRVTVSVASPDVPNNPSNRSWFGPAGVIRESDKFEVSSNRYTLIVYKIDQSDVGVYTFTATNTAGSTTAAISLTIGIGSYVLYKLVLTGISNHFLLFQLLFPL